MDEKKRELVMQATGVYMRLGIKSVTMDEMARQLGISKKTIYQYVTDKNDLVMQCILLNQEEEERAIREIVAANKNAIDQLLKISTYMTNQLQQIHPSIFFDLAKYHPTVVKTMDCHKSEFVGGCIIGNLKLGIEQGYYRENLDAGIIAMIHLSMADSLMSGSSAMLDVKLDEFYSEFIRYHIRGIASAKGLKHLEQLVKIDPELKGRL